MPTSTTYSNVASVSYARQENGTCKYETRGTIDHYSYRRVTLLVPKGEVDITVEDGQRFLNLVKMKYLEAGCRINASTTSNVGGGLLNCKSPPPTSNPQHRILIDSTTFDECGSFKPLVTSYVMNPDPASLLQTELFLLYTNYTKSYQIWLNDASRVKMQLIVRWELYDLRSTQFWQQKPTRSWVVERTMTRRMAKKLEQSTGTSTAPRHKGVRWRPERKHPWVAELKLPKRKKMWIGNFDTPEEAAQAYIEAAKCYQRHKTVLQQSQGASHHEHVCVQLESKLPSPIASLQHHRARDTSINISSSLSDLQRHSSAGGLRFSTPGGMMCANDLTSNDHDRETDKLRGSNSEIDKLCGSNSEASVSDELTSNDHDHEIDKFRGSNSEDSVSDGSRALFEPRDLSGPKDMLSAYICNNTSRNINAEIESPYMFAKDLPVMDDRSFRIDRLSTSNQNMFDCLDPFELVS